jgi:hypothetical protein
MRRAWLITDRDGAAIVYVGTEEREEQVKASVAAEMGLLGTDEAFDEFYGYVTVEQSHLHHWLQDGVNFLGGQVPLPRA